MKKLILLLMIICFKQIHAQITPTKASYVDKMVSYSINNKKIKIEFGSNKKIDNLLVLISDSLGHTIFLDNQYNFSGNYTRMIDLINPGKYFLKINYDDEKINKTLTIE